MSRERVEPIDPRSGYMTEEQMNALLQQLAGPGIHVAFPRIRQHIQEEATGNAEINGDARRIFKDPETNLYITAVNNGRYTPGNPDAKVTGDHWALIVIPRGLIAGQEKAHGIGYDPNATRFPGLRDPINPQDQNSLSLVQILNIDENKVHDLSARHQDADRREGNEDSPLYSCGGRVREAAGVIVDKYKKGTLADSLRNPAALSAEFNAAFNRENPNYTKETYIATYNEKLQGRQPAPGKPLTRDQKVDAEGEALKELFGKHTFQAELEQKKLNDINATEAANEEARRKRPFDTINTTLDNLNSGIQAIDLETWNKTVVSVFSVLFAVSKAVYGIAEACVKTVKEIEELNRKIKSGTETTKLVDELEEKIYKTVEIGLKNDKFSDIDKQYIVDNNGLRPERKAELMATYKLPKPTPEVQEGKVKRISEIPPENSPKNLKDKGMTVADGNAHQKPSHADQIKKQQESPRAKL